MRPMALLFASIPLLAIAACNKSSGDASAAGSASAAAMTTPAPTTSAPAAASTAKPAPKSEYTASDLWTEVSGMMRIDVLGHPPVTISGTISAIKDDPTGEYGIDIDAGGGHAVELRFADFGKAAKAKKLKAGASVAANQCTVTMPKDNQLALVGCVLK
jgi:hypothetical protein